MATTRRIDPTLVYIPEERDRISRRRVKLRRALAISLGVVIVAAAGSGVWFATKGERERNRVAQAREDMAQREMRLLSEAIVRFKEDIGRYPTDQEGLASLNRRPFNASESWSGPYLDGIYEVDPWGSEYVYRLIDNGSDFELVSHGPEGETGGLVYLRVTSQEVR